MLWKCCTQYASKFGKLSSGHKTGKGQFSFQSQRKAMPECSNCLTIALISHASKIMLKILQARLQQYVNCEIPDVQAGFRKDRGTCPVVVHRVTKSRTQLSLHALLYYYDKLWKILKEIGQPDLPPEKSECRSGSNSYNWTWNNSLVPNRKRSTSRLYIVTLLN